MRETLLPLLINPYTGNDLKMDNDTLIDEITGERYKIINGIPVLYRETDIFDKHIILNGQIKI